MTARGGSTKLGLTLALILDRLTGDAPKDEPTPVKNEVVAALGRLGGKKGGVAIDKALTQECKSEIAKRAEAKQWVKK